MAFWQTAPSQILFSPLLCGGTNKDQHNRDCFHLDPMALDEDPVGQLASFRLAAASVVIGNGAKLWITGGFDEHFFGLDTSEMISLTVLAFDGKVAVESQVSADLPFPVAYHCLELVFGGNDAALLFGGMDMFIQQPEKAAWLAIINGNEVSWIESQPMTLARSSHMCGAVRYSFGKSRVIVAAGGMLHGRRITPTVELLEIQDGDDLATIAIAAQWQSGPNIPISLCCAGAATTQDQGRRFSWNSNNHC